MYVWIICIRIRLMSHNQLFFPSAFKEVKAFNLVYGQKDLLANQPGFRERPYETRLQAEMVKTAI